MNVLPLLALTVVTPRALTLGGLIAEGNFGTVHWAQNAGAPCVAKCAKEGERADAVAVLVRAEGGVGLAAEAIAGAAGARRRRQRMVRRIVGASRV